MLVTALVATLGGALAAPFLAAGTAADATATGVWLAAVATLGSWGALVTGSLGDFLREEQPPRRTMNLLAGMTLGVAAFGLAAALGSSLPWYADWNLDRGDVVVKEVFGYDPYEGASFDSRQVAPPLAASVIYFGVMFFVTRWWRSTDYLRRSRVSLFPVLLAGLGAWAPTLVCWYPQPLGVVAGGLMALALQVASPWCPPSRRAALARGEGARGDARTEV
jgi:MFS family permease